MSLESGEAQAGPSSSGGGGGGAGAAQDPRAEGEEEEEESSSGVVRQLVESVLHRAVLAVDGGAGAAAPAVPPEPPAAAPAVVRVPHEDLVSILQFLESTSSQMTAYGLFELRERLSNGELAVLFRNNHFSTLYKRDGQLYALMTDQGYEGQGVAWEVLLTEDGNTTLVSDTALLLLVLYPTWLPGACVSRGQDVSRPVFRHPQVGADFKEVGPVAVEDQLLPPPPPDPKAGPGSAAGYDADLALAIQVGDAAIVPCAPRPQQEGDLGFFAVARARVCRGGAQAAAGGRIGAAAGRDE